MYFINSFVIKIIHTHTQIYIQLNVTENCGNQYNHSEMYTDHTNQGRNRLLKSEALKSLVGLIHI